MNTGIDKGLKHGKLAAAMLLAFSATAALARVAKALPASL